MTEDALKRGNEIKSLLKNLKDDLCKMVEADGSFIFTQRQRGRGDDMTIQVGRELTSELDKQVRTVLLATKQTIRSMYELEIAKLEDELKKL